MQEYTIAPYDMQMTSATIGRREAKRRETSDALVASALALFAERGYQATTIADIAAAAGIAPRTFFGYFATKELVLYSPVEALVVDLEAVLGEGPEDALSALRSWTHARAAWLDGDFRGLRRLIQDASDESHTVALTGLLFIERLSTAVARRLRADLGASADDPMPDIAAAAAVAALATALPMGMSFRYSEGAPYRQGRLLEDLDTAIAFARAGLDAVRQGRV